MSTVYLGKKNNIDEHVLRFPYVSKIPTTSSPKNKKLPLHVFPKIKDYSYMLLYVSEKLNN